MNDTMKNITLLVARVLVSGLFIYTGIGKLMDIGATAAYAGLPEWMVWVAALVEVIGGAMLLLGLFTRYAATLLFVYMIAVNVVMHLPLTADDPGNTVQFFKNLSVMGGFAALLVSGGGRYQLYKD